jgi:hypothetical protein
LHLRPDLSAVSQPDQLAILINPEEVMTADK